MRRTTFIVAALAILLIAGGVRAEWRYIDQVNPFNDIASQQAINLTADGRNVSLACREENLYVLVEEPTLFHSENMIAVQHRFDKKIAKTGEWHWVGPSAILIGGEAGAFAKNLMNHERLILKVGDGEIHEVSLEGSAAPIRKVLLA